MQAPLVNMKGEEVGKVDLRDEIFGRKVSTAFLHEFVTIYEANQRRWTANTKTRAEVSGGGRKPWKQKHTGRARAGSTRSPLWRHGGIIFGPRANRGARLDIPRQKAKEALAQALSGRFSDGKIAFLDRIEMEEPKTKTVAQMLKSLKCQGSSLLILDASDQKISRASRNIADLTVMLAADLNAYAVLRYKKLLVTASALEKLSSRWN